MKNTDELWLCWLCGTTNQILGKCSTKDCKAEARLWSKASDFLKKRYIKDDPKRLASLEAERIESAKKREAWRKKAVEELKDDAEYTTAWDDPQKSAEEE